MGLSELLSRLEAPVVVVNNRTIRRLRIQLIKPGKKNTAFIGDSHELEQCGHTYHGDFTVSRWFPNGTDVTKRQHEEEMVGYIEAALKKGMVNHGKVIVMVHDPMFLQSPLSGGTQTALTAIVRLIPLDATLGVEYPWSPSDVIRKELP